jgi:phage recombination protein Bet
MTSSAITTTTVAPTLSLSDPDKLGALKDAICADLNGPEFEAFLIMCEHRRLDPFSKQVYAIVRGEGQWRKVSWQTAIDGFRAIAERSGRYRGIVSTEWCAEDGAWRPIWTAARPPAYARVRIQRDGWVAPTEGLARWGAYVQTKRGGEIVETWAKMGPEQLAKCAEAQALRKAFPEDLGAIYAPEETEYVVQLERTNTGSAREVQGVLEDAEPSSLAGVTPAARGRGRPPGSANRPKPEAPASAQPASREADAPPPEELRPAAQAPDRAAPAPAVPAAASTPVKPPPPADVAPTLPTLASVRLAITSATTEEEVELVPAMIVSLRDRGVGTIADRNPLIAAYKARLAELAELAGT